MTVPVYSSHAGADSSPACSPSGRPFLAPSSPRPAEQRIRLVEEENRVRVLHVGERPAGGSFPFRRRAGSPPPPYQRGTGALRSNPASGGCGERLSGSRRAAEQHQQPAAEREPLLKRQVAVNAGSGSSSGRAVRKAASRPLLAKLLSGAGVCLRVRRKIGGRHPRRQPLCERYRSPRGLSATGLRKHISGCAKSCDHPQPEARAAQPRAADRATASSISALRELERFEQIECELRGGIRVGSDGVAFAQGVYFSRFRGEPERTEPASPARTKYCQGLRNVSAGSLPT